MRSTTKHSSLHGFEDYTILNFGADLLNPNKKIGPYDLWSSVHYSYIVTYYLIDNDRIANIPISKSNSYYSSDYIDWNKIINFNNSILDSAKTVYVYPECKIPRSHIAKKYKKVLSPWKADAIVMPEVEDYTNPINKGLFFINDTTKEIYIIKGDSADAINVEGKEGTEYSKFLSAYAMSGYQTLSDKPIVGHLLQSTLLGRYNYTYFYTHEAYKIDILDNVIPTSKLVSENAVMKSLGDSENEITYENLKSIQEMLDSRDNDAVGSAIKALAAMDYMSCPQSIKYVLEYASSSWRYNDAADTTAAKYMFKCLIGGTARHCIRFNDNEISQKDYDIFKQLVFDNYTGPDAPYAKDYLRNMSFTYEDAQYNVYPRLKVS